MVRDTFKPKVGQKVAIAVLFSDETKPTEATIAGCAGPVRLQDFPETFTLEEVYGEVGKLNTHTMLEPITLSIQSIPSRDAQVPLSFSWT